MEPVVTPALEGGFLTTGLPGKSFYFIFLKQQKTGKTASLGGGDIRNKGNAEC